MWYLFASLFLLISGKETFVTEPVAESEEWFDVVDEQDRVLRAAPRSEVHGQKLLHRAAHVWVFNSRQELLVHLRAAGKEEEPLRWTSSAAGHLSAGESYAEAAERELQEELGLQAPLIWLHKLPSGPEVGYEHTALFSCVCDAPPQPDPGEIAEYRFLPIPEIQAWIESAPQDFTNPFRQLMKWYVNTQAG